MTLFQRVFVQENKVRNKVKILRNYMIEYLRISQKITNFTA